MFRSLLNIRSLLALIAILIVSGTVWYSSYLAAKIEREERQKVEQWVEASNVLLSPANTDTRLPFKIIQDNDDIPIIWTNEKDSIFGYLNLDSAKAEDHASGYLKSRLRAFSRERAPITPISIRWTRPASISITTAIAGCLPRCAGILMCSW
jgi:hypothetical protein